MSRPTPDRPDDDEDLLTHLIARAGDRHVEPRPKHVTDLRALLLDRVSSARVARRWKMWPLMGSSLAAACLLAVLRWVWHDPENQVPGPTAGRPVPYVTPRAPEDFPSNVPWLEARRVLDPSKNATFNWPVQEMVSLLVSSSVPSDLLD